jgi:hypothetical protein
VRARSLGGVTDFFLSRSDPRVAMWLRVTFVAFSISLVGCGGDSSAGVEPIVDPLTITISPTPALIVGVGETLLVSATARNAAGVPVSVASVSWSSGNTGIMTIDGNGLASGVSTGVTTVSATIDGSTGSTPLEAFVPQLVSVYEAGTSYFGRNGYVEYIPGELPVVLSAPHGGALKPSEVSDRTLGVTGSDRNTAELALAIRVAFVALTGAAPHVIISHLHRSKLDPNREIVEAADGSVFAENAWNEFQGFVEIARQTVSNDFGSGMYFDLHGHGHAIDRLELGYLLSREKLNGTDASLDPLAVAQTTSIRALAQSVAIPFSELLRGPMSFGGYLEDEGVRSVPSPSDPSPGSDPYFSGGYNTRRHGSLAFERGEVISGIQIEHQFPGIRDTAANRRAYADRLSAVTRLFMLEHFGFFE